GGAAYLADEEVGLSSVRVVAEDKAKEPKKAAPKAEQKDDKATPTPEPQDDDAAGPPADAEPAESASAPGTLSRPKWPLTTPGALLLAQVDRERYLGFGLPRQ